jgi:hypothetical protein
MQTLGFQCKMNNLPDRDLDGIAFRPSRVPPTVDVTGWFRRPFRVLEAATGSPVEALECSGPGTEPEPSVCLPLSWRISGFRATSGYSRHSRPDEFQIGHSG